MKKFLRIKRICIFPEGNMKIILRCGMVVVFYDEDFIIENTGEVLEPLCDEVTDEIIGFMHK